nr:MULTISPECIES: DMT family transporter [unclassified Roseivivax]
MEPWILFTLLAAAFQTVRFMLQKVMSAGGLSATASSFARFAYAMPFALVAAALWAAAGSGPPGALAPVFWIYAPLGALAQILATICVVALFAHRSFAVGITLKKTEVLQTALVGWLILGETVSAAGLAAMVLGLVGVLLLSDTPGLTGRWWQRIGLRVVLLGLASGLFFGLSGVGYRGAALAVGADDPVSRALFALAPVTVMQTIALGLWLRVTAPGTLTAVARWWPKGIWLGLTSVGGSFGWFAAFSLQNAAYVFAVGQVELIFSLAASVLFFRERATRRELAGIAILCVSIIALVAAV